MSAITSYKKQFEEANKQLADDELDLLKVNEQMQTLQRKREDLEKKIQKDRENKVVKGLLYYSEERRSVLLDKADELKYSRKTIQRLRTYDKNQWNTDSVDHDLIADFETVEKYVNGNTPSWEKSPFAKFGKMLNRD